MGNRAAFVKSFLADLDAICPGHGNETFYAPFFDSLDDKQFEAMIDAIEAEDLVLPLVLPNGKDANLDAKRNIALGRKWGHEFREQVWLTDPVNPGLVKLTPLKYLIIKLPVRRQAQTLEDKQSIPKDDHSIDDLTGQVSNESKGSGISGPEAQILYSHDLKAVLIEYLKVRGGDETAYRKMSSDLINSGVASLTDAVSQDSRPTSVVNLSTMLTCAHIGNNL